MNNEEYYYQINAKFYIKVKNKILVNFSFTTTTDYF